MKIIKRGQLKAAEAPKQATCNKCETVFEFTPSEARYVCDARDGDYYHVDCPVCRAIVTKAVKA